MNRVVVVGCSVTGALAAKEAALAGAKVTVLEEDKQPGKFHKCSGIVSKKGLDSLGVDYSPSVLHEIFGANIYSAKGRKFTVRNKDVVALVLDRQYFDELCTREAIQAGAVLKLGEKVTNQKNNAVFTKSGAAYEYDFLIGADGASSTVANLFDFPKVRTKDFALAYEAEFENATVEDEHLVDVFLDNKLFPGFFGWAIPVGKNKVRLGFGTNVHAGFEERRLKFLEKYLPKYNTSKACVKCREFWHPIPLKVRSTTSRGNVFLVGDAAGQVKSTTGGGIVFGGNCAKIAGRLAASGSKAYEKQWRSRFATPLVAHRKIRRAFDILPNSLVNLTVIGFDKLLLSKFLSEFGDMDFILSGKK